MPIIYIVSPKSFTGGPESLHQLGSYFIERGLDVRIYYANGYQRFNRKFHSSKISPRLQAYEVPYTENILDSPDNILIVPEVYVGLLSQYKYIKKCIWWLSLEYYFNSVPEYVVKHSKYPKILKLILISLYHEYLKIRNNVNQYAHLIPVNQEDIFHMYNCDSVRQYLLNMGVCESNMVYLCGPIEEIYFTHQSTLQSRENIVLYNPRKGFEFTKKIIKHGKNQLINVEFIPIQNMNAKEIVNIMDKSKVYMDFGYFPGPERIPREAVTRGCCIITSKTGCAGNSIDVPIPDEFKFETIDENIQDIISMLDELVRNYDTNYSKYDTYRAKVMSQKELFVTGVDVFMRFFNL